MGDGSIFSALSQFHQGSDFLLRVLDTGTCSFNFGTVGSETDSPHKPGTAGKAYVVIRECSQECIALARKASIVDSILARREEKGQRRKMSQSRPSFITPVYRDAMAV